ncbi:lysine -specific demethylase 4c-like protein [Ilyonectria robusta]
MDAPESCLASRVDGIEKIVVSLRRLVFGQISRARESTDPSTGPSSGRSPDQSTGPSTHHQSTHHQSTHHQSTHHQSTHHQSTHHQSTHHQSTHHQSTHQSTLDPETPIWTQIIHALDQVTLEVQSIQSELRSTPTPRLRDNPVEHVESRTSRFHTPKGGDESRTSLSAGSEQSNGDDDDLSMSPATTPEEDDESASLLSTPKDTPEGSSAEEDHEEEAHDMSTVSEDKDSESADPKEADPEEEGEEEYGVGHEEPQAPQKGETEDGINPPPSPEVEPADTAHSSASPAFSLTSDDTGERLVPALAKIVRHPNFSNKISVTTTPLDLARLERAMRENDLDCTSQDYVAGPDGSGYSNLYISADKSEFKWPDFSQAIEKPTDDEVEEFLEGVVGHPQKDRVHYCCGVASVPFDNPLHPGEVLARFEDLTIANEQYYHAGWSRSATPFHCEDAGFWSCNRTEVG